MTRPLPPTPPAGPPRRLVAALAATSLAVAAAGIAAAVVRHGGGSGTDTVATHAPTPTLPPSAPPTSVPSQVHTPTARPSPSATPSQVHVRVRATSTSTTRGAGAPNGRTTSAAAPTSTPTPTPTQAPGGSSTPQPTSTASQGGGPGGGSGSPRAVQPAPTGSYTYATSGSERVSLPGSRRTFPKTTTIAVDSYGCGQRLTWQPNRQHKETQVLCARGPKLHLASYSSRIGFYGGSSSEQLSCSQDAYVYSTTLRAGDTWSFACSSKDSKAHQKLTVVGFRTVDVDGTPVRTLRIHIATTLSGADAGTSTQDIWIGTRTALLVRNVGSVDATQDSVEYTEHYSLRLASTTPS